MKHILKVCILFFLLGIVCGFDIPNYDGYVTDKVGVFSATEIAALTGKITEIGQTTSIEIAILVVPTVDDDINLAAADVGNKRGVGKKGQDNGLVLLIAVDDRKWSIQVGYGLEGTLPDLITKQIGEAHFPPNFRNGNYYQGVVEMLDDVLGYIKQDPTIVQNYSSNTTTGSFDKDSLELYFFLGITIIMLFGRWVTVPKPKGTGRKMKKYGWRIYAGAGILFALLITWLIANLLLSLFLSYAFLLVGIIASLFGRVGSRGSGIWFSGGSGGGSWGGGSSFGGGGFGGGGSSGSR